MNRRTRSLPCIVVLAALAAATAFPQCADKKGIARAICEAASGKVQILRAPDDALVGGLINQLLDPNRQPLTSSFADARRGRTLPETFQPEKFQPLRSLPRSPEGAYLLLPGAYEGDVQSFCLKAGTYGPSKGAGYLPAPLEGPKAEIVRSILKRSILHPEVRQQEIQVLLWAIIARTELDDMPAEMQRTARALLTPQQLSQLNGPLGRLPKAMREPLERKLQDQLRLARSPLQGVLQAESRIRQQVSSSSSYGVLEQTAVLMGLAPDHAQSIPPVWTQHPQGFFVRHLPHGYSSTKIQVYVPEPTLPGAQPVAYDPSEELAMPANTGGQRLGMSARDGEGERLSCPVPDAFPTAKMRLYTGSLHTALEIDTSNGPVSVGFGPAVVASLVPTPGRIDVDGKGYADLNGMKPVATYAITLAEGDRIARKLRELKDNPPMYHPASFNCNQFTCWVATAAGVGGSMLRCLLPLEPAVVESIFN